VCCVALLVDAPRTPAKTEGEKGPPEKKGCRGPKRLELGRNACDFKRQTGVSRIMRYELRDSRWSPLSRCWPKKQAGRGVLGGKTEPRSGGFQRHFWVPAIPEHPWARFDGKRVWARTTHLLQPRLRFAGGGRGSGAGYQCWSTKSRAHDMAIQMIDHVIVPWCNQHGSFHYTEPKAVDGDDRGADGRAKIRGACGWNGPAHTGCN